MKDKQENIRQRAALPAILGGRPAFDKPVPITVPTIPKIEALKRRYEKVLRSGMITNSASVQEFESRVARYLGVTYAIAVSSCTSGLMLIMKTLGLKGEVILPSFTFHATAHAAVWNNLQPVFVDCDPETFNLDPQAVRRAITPRTSAIIAVHIFGNPPAISLLEKIAGDNGLKLIFDAAHGFGSKYQGRYVGGFGEAESFSLSPTKLLTAGEGGIVTTNNEEIAKKIRAGRNYGDTGNYDPEFSGLSARMSEFNALLGIESLEILEKNIIRRNKMVEQYKKRLGALPGLTFQKIKAGDRSSYKDFSIHVDKRRFGLNRDQLHNALMAENIVVKKYFYPAVHQQKAFETYAADETKLQNTVRVANCALSLPLFSHIEAGTVEKICAAVARIHKHRNELI